MLDKSSKHRLIGAVLMLISAAAVLPIILDGERPPELDVKISVAEAPLIPEVKIAPIQPIEKLTAVSRDASSNWAPIIAEKNNVNGAKSANSEVIKAPVVVENPNIEKPSDRTRWAVQIATFKNRDNASRLTENLMKANYSAYTITTNNLFKVFVGPELNREKAESFKDEIKKEFQMTGIVVKYSEN